MFPVRCHAESKVITMHYLLTLLCVVYCHCGAGIVYFATGLE